MKKIIINKKKLLIVLSISIAIFLLVLLISEIGWAVAMQKGPEPIELPKELIQMEKNMMKKYDIPAYTSVMNKHIGGVSYNKGGYILEKNIKECMDGKLNKKLIFYIDLEKAQNEKYFDEGIMVKEADSINNLIQKYLPHKECIDSLYINIYISDSISNNKIFCEKIRKKNGKCRALYLS